MYTIIHNENKLLKILKSDSNIVFDIEANDLLPNVSKIHCLAFESNGEFYVVNDLELIKTFFKEVDGLIGHNIVLYDLPAIEKVLGVEYKGNIIDTMALSWYLNTSPGSKHGLEYYGELYGYPKKDIDDWDNLSIEEYNERCAIDVVINCMLFADQMQYINHLYKEKGNKKKILSYLTFKMSCLRRQEENPLKVDVVKVMETIEKLTALKHPMEEALRNAMPKVEKTSIRNKPKVMYKKDESLSVAGERWNKLLKENNLPEDFEGPVEVVTKLEEPNPNSHNQVKDWLFSLGWKPCTFEERINSKGELNSVPQIRKDGELVDSVLRLSKKEPAIEALEEISVLGHRISFLEGLLKNVDDEGFLIASAFGFTNTLRFRHRNFVNVPGVHAPYGKDIRECFVAPEGYTMIGSDLSGLEDSTKMHYIFPYDPEYVKEMMSEDFDPHLDVAVLSGILTEEQVLKHKEGIEDYSTERAAGKTVNFSSMYGVGVKTLSKSLGSTIKYAKKLLDAYWKRNWAIKTVAESITWRKIDDQMWLLNPVSDMWYPLRYEKDIFSTLNQGTGVYCFDTWVAFLVSHGMKISAQMHDEIVEYCKKGEEDVYKEILLKSMEKANNRLNLNVTLGVDIQFGDNYAEVH